MRNRSDHGPRMIRPWSENDPTTHETVSHPSHRRGRSSTFGDALCLEKHRVSCITISQKRISCETSFKTPSATHLHCGNDPTVANTLSTAHARKTLETPFTMRNRSDHGPRMIRPWSENDPTTHETVSHPSHRRLIHQHHLQSHLH